MSRGTTGRISGWIIRVKIPNWLMPTIAAALMTIAIGSFKFYSTVQLAIATMEDDSLYQEEDADQQNARLEWLRDRVNELRIKHELPLEGWPK